MKPFIILLLVFVGCTHTDQETVYPINPLDGIHVPTDIIRQIPISYEAPIAVPSVDTSPLITSLVIELPESIAGDCHTESSSDTSSFLDNTKI